MLKDFSFPESNVVVTVVSTEELLERAYQVRLKVFVEEQLVPLEEEIDALDVDPNTVHVLAIDTLSGSALGTARLLPTPGKPGHFHIGRVAVDSYHRGRNVGAALMTSLERIAVSRTQPDAVPVVIELSAQIQASGFYHRLGYEQISQRQYLDAGILHVDMAKTL